MTPSTLDVSRRRKMTGTGVAASGEAAGARGEPQDACAEQELGAGDAVDVVLVRHALPPFDRALPWSRPPPASAGGPAPRPPCPGGTSVLDPPPQQRAH